MQQNIEGRLTTCSKCGEFNPVNRRYCLVCGASLSNSEVIRVTSDFNPPRQRSGCVTILVILLVLGGIVSLIGFIREPTQSALFWLFLAPTYFLAAWGLWRLKTWGVILSIGLLCLDLLLNFVDYGCLGGIIGLPLGGYVLYWLITHFDDFD